MRKIKFILGALILALSSSSMAALIQIDFTGTVYDIQHYRGIEIGDPFIASLTYDADLPTHGITIGPNYTEYYYQGITSEPIGVTGSIGSLAFSTSYQDTIVVTNTDTFLSGADSFSYLSGDVTFNGDFLGVDSFTNFQISDESSLSFSNTQLPSVETLLDGSFGEAFMSLSGILPGTSQQFNIYGRGTITAYEVSAVPAPAAIWLFSTALIGLVGFSRRKKAG